MKLGTVNFDRNQPDAANGFHFGNAHLIVSSHLRLVQRELLPDTGDRIALARGLYHAPFVVLAHEVADDPIFFYANLSAQTLFEMSWQEMVALPSRLSAEAPARGERLRLLDRVRRHGFIDDYAGVRISATGKRFRIAAATVWNLIDGEGRARGQAAAFGSWFPLT